MKTETMHVMTLGAYRAALLSDTNLEQKEAAWQDLNSCYLQAMDCDRFEDTPLPPCIDDVRGSLEQKVLLHTAAFANWWIETLMPEEREALNAAPVVLRS